MEGPSSKRLETLIQNIALFVKPLPIRLHNFDCLIILIKVIFLSISFHLTSSYGVFFFCPYFTEARTSDNVLVGW